MPVPPLDKYGDTDMLTPSRESNVSDFEMEVSHSVTEASKIISENSLNLSNVAQIWICTGVSDHTVVFITISLWIDEGEVHTENCSSVID